MNKIKSLFTFISILKDFLIIFVIFNQEFSNALKVYPSLLTVLCLIIYWILFNYVLGQYEFKFIKLKEKISKNIINTFLVLISANFIYMTINLITDEVNISISDLFIFINIIFKLFIFIIISQSILDIIMKNNYEEINQWLILADEERYQQIIYLNSQFTNNYKIIKIQDDISNININEFKGLIIDQNIDLDKINKKLYFEIKKNNLKIINTLLWFEKYLQISPSDFQGFNDILTLKSQLNFNNSHYRIKRIGDIFLSLFLIITLLPLLFFIVVCLLITQGMPIFYSQSRSGLNGKEIKIIKFRTMIKNAEKDGPQWSKKNDKRVTFLGKILRKFRLDELPQLINVIRGDMSLIGPRPERPKFDEELNSKISNYKIRYSIKPGISGWAQVNYHYGSNLNDVINKLNYDIYYIKYQSTYLDFLILFKTLKIIFNARGWVSKF